MRCYALRQLNPFSGVLQVVDTRQARAFSNNGVLWRLQVVSERPGHTWRSGNDVAVRQYFNWAMWSAAKGMHKVNANPILDIGAMSRAAEQLVEALQPCLAELPFALQDRFEYWGCDAQDEPLALLSSAQQAVPPHGDVQRLGWRACDPHGPGFVSQQLLDADLPDSAGAARGSHAEYLEMLVNRTVQSRHWFRRDTDGGGVRLDGECQLPAGQFPPQGVRQHWSEQQASAAFADYIAWLAPVLLTLPELQAQRRAELERQAVKRATRVSDLYRLYPNIEQPDLIRQALVEARLRRAEGAETGDPVPPR